MEKDIFNQDFLTENTKLNEIKASDFILAYKIMKDLGTKWTDFDAYELGLIDKDGKRLRYAETSQEKDSMTSYMKMIFNLKRIMGKVVKSNLGQKIVVSFLLKEDIQKNTIKKLINEYDLRNFNENCRLDERDEKIYIKTFLEAYYIEY